MSQAKQQIIETEHLLQEIVNQDKNFDSEKLIDCFEKSSKLGLNIISSKYAKQRKVDYNIIVSILRRILLV